MKFCPKCKMNVDAHCECPACKNNLTDEPYSEQKCESYAFNKYLIPYVLKKRGLSVACIAIFIVRLIIKHNIDSWYSFIASLILVVACFLFSFFKNGMAELDSWKYSDEYIELVHKISKYLCGVLGIVFSFLW